MAAKHNCYFAPTLPKTTISCGTAMFRSQYIGLLENTRLNRSAYDPDPLKATYDLMSRA
jgi:hypothetical protein